MVELIIGVLLFVIGYSEGWNDQKYLQRIQKRQAHEHAHDQELQ